VMADRRQMVYADSSCGGLCVTLIPSDVAMNMKITTRAELDRVVPSILDG
jgi:hypothetical protein